MLRNRLFPAALVIAWLAALAAGGRWLLGYQNAAGRAGQAPEDWPPTAAIRPAPGRCTLLLFAHPHCPCTRAALEELNWVLARSRDQLDAWVVLVCPDGAPPGWERTGRWRTAEVAPGARVLADPGGEEARRFGAATSGQVLLYDPRGRLAFRGGITDGRGHQGDNPGRRAVLRQLGGDGGEPQSCPVFGCPLFDTDAPCAGGGPTCVP